MNPTVGSGYGLLYEGRFARGARLVALAVIVGTAFIGSPHPGVTGRGLVILVSLVVAALTQVAVTLFPAGPWALGRSVVAAVSCGILAGYEPTVGTAILLVFVGAGAGASFDFGTGGAVVALVVVSTTLGVLASGEGAATISLGTVGIVGFLAAAGRRQYALRAEEAELRLADAERVRGEHARAVALAERANAAREIHDILAHSLGALVLQLDALDAVLEAETPDRGRATELLTRARALAVEGLREARQAVGTLRTDTPRLIDGLRQLVGRGTPRCRLRIEGAPRPVSAEATVALLRTAQEGLTNAAKHAPGAEAAVTLSFGPTEVILTVTDGGSVGGDDSVPGPLAHTGGGYGIEGLRERAELLGGTLAVGPLGAGWQVELRVPEGPGAPERETA
ncbi:MAG TPA: histidine kinase [Acidimicrobiales bacterium]